MSVAERSGSIPGWTRKVRRWARPVVRRVRQLDLALTGEWGSRRHAARAERARLRRSWAKIPAETLDDYLVSGYQNPRINAQSILARHFLIGKLFGTEFDTLMREELEFCVEANAALRQRAAELDVKMGQFTAPEKRTAVKQVCEVIADRENTFETKWSEALRDRVAKPLRVLEFACGSANDYRFLESYGIAASLDYTGVDLNDNNVRNARQRYPDVKFEAGSILNLPYADESFDYVLAFDIFEHLSLDAMEQAMKEAMRLAKKGIVIAFFIMVDKPEHNVRPKGTYHWNELSADKIRELLQTKFPSVTMTHVRTFLKEEYSAEHSYNGKAWTAIAERP